MDELWGILIVAAIVIALIALLVVYVVLPIIGIAIGIAAVLAVIASGSGIVAGIKNFVETLALAQIEARKKTEAEPFPPVTKPLFSRFNQNPQPAFLIYFYDAAWSVIDYTRRNVWVNTGRDAQDWFDRGGEWQQKSRSLYRGFNIQTVPALWWAGAASGAYIGGGFHYVAALLIVTVFIFFQLAYIVFGVLVSSLIMLVLSGVNWIYGTYYRIYFRCPHPGCHSEMSIPIYICNQCSTPHSKLWPSIYGVFNHECRGKMPDGTICGNLLPTSDWWGRSPQLDRVCPTCNRPLTKAIGAARNIHIPIVGGPFAGKSNYLVAATQQFMEDYAPEHKLTIDLPDEKHRIDFERNIQMLKLGETLLKTSDADESAMAYNLQIRRSRQRVPSLLYVYDASGEYYTEEDRAMRQVYFKYVHGIILIVDPFSIDLVRETYSDRLTRDGKALSPSTESLESVYERMIKVFETYFALRPGKKFPHPIAVVVTKVDAFDLEDHIGSSAARRLMEDNPNIRFEEDAIHFLVEQFLVKHGAQNLIFSLENQFSKVKYFSCSAIGHGMGYSPFRVLSPLLWIMGQVSVLPVAQERSQKVDEQDNTLGKKQGNGLVGSLRYYIWDSLKPVESHEDITDR